MTRNRTSFFVGALAAALVFGGWSTNSATAQYAYGGGSYYYSSSSYGSYGSGYSGYRSYNSYCAPTTYCAPTYCAPTVYCPPRPVYYAPAPVVVRPAYVPTYSYARPYYRSGPSFGFSFNYSRGHSDHYRGGGWGHQGRGRRGR